MAKEVIFESEKLERRQKRRRLLLPLFALAAIIVLAVIIALIVGKSRGRQYSGGEDTLYPYEWTEKRDGSLVFELPEPKTAGYVWQVTNSVETTANITEEAKPTKGMKRYLVTPLAAGRTLMELKLSNTAEGSYGDQLFILDVVLDVAGENGILKTTLHSAAGRELPGVVSGGDPEGWPYQINASGPLEITVYLKDRMKKIDGAPDEMPAASIPAGATYPEVTIGEASYIMNAWDCTSSDDRVVRVDSMESLDGLVTVRLDLTGADGSASVVLLSQTGGAELSFTVTVAEDGKCTIGDDQLNVFEPQIVTPPDSDEMVTITADNPVP